MRTVKIDYPLEPINKDGVFSFIAECREKYRADKKIVYKVFKEEWKPIETFMWKHTTLLEATKIQNILHFDGFAPRVYDLVTLDTPKGKFWAQVTDFISEGRRGPLKRYIALELHKYRKANGIKIISVDPNSHHDYVDIVVDTDNLTFDKDVYEKKLIELIKKDGGWGSNPKPYNSVPELGIVGQRNQNQRLKFYDLDSIDFKGKTVIDYGCSTGEMCREAVRRGAKRVVGLDQFQVVRVAQELSNYLGYFNIDYLGGNFDHRGVNNVYDIIREFSGIEKFDIVFYLSCQQLGMPDYLDKIVGEVFLLEGHTGDHHYTYMGKLNALFEKVDFKGHSNDHGSRPVFICREANGKN